MMNIKIIQKILDVCEYYGQNITMDIERFEEALNDEAPDLLDECYLVVQGLKLGIMDIMLLDAEYERKNYVERLIKVHQFTQEEALFIVSVFEALTSHIGFYFEIGNLDALLEYSMQHDQFLEIYAIAKAYFKGFGVKQDYEKAFQLFQYLYAHGDDRGSYYLGYMYEMGYGVEQDEQKAMMYYENGHDDMCYYQMGMHLMLGQSVHQDEEKALSYFEKSHYPDAYFYQGFLLEKQHEYASAFQAYSKGSQVYQRECLYKVGMYLNHGLGTDLNQKEAYRYLTYSYYCLHGDSAYQLSMMYFDGLMVKKDVNKAIELLKQAAHLYSQEACLLLGRFYGEGHYVEKNFQKSMNYYKKANEIIKCRNQYLT